MMSSRMMEFEDDDVEDVDGEDDDVEEDDGKDERCMRKLLRMLG